MNTKKILWVTMWLSSSLCMCAQNVSSNDEAFDSAISQLKSSDSDDVIRDKAIKTIKMLADKGYGRALNEIGTFYAAGEISEFPQDCQKAKEYFLKAWKAKCTQAAQNLSVLYLTGICCPPDTALAFEWTKKSAEVGNALSMHDLGIYYLEPRYGHEIDTINAIGWLRKSAEAGCGNAMWELARFYHNKGNAQEERYWLQEGVAIDDINCLYIYGMTLKNGSNGTERDEIMAAEYFKKAADLYGFGPAEEEYGFFCDSRRDYRTALTYFERAANKDCLRSMAMIGDYYSKGRGEDITSNHATAFEWYLRGANTQAQTALEQTCRESCQALVGLCYYFGRGVEMDRKKGSSIMYQLAGQGCESAKKYIKDYDIE